MITLDAVGGVWRYAMDLAHGLRSDGTACLLIGSGPAPSDHHLWEAAEAQVDLRWTDDPLDWLAEREADLEPVARNLHWHAVEWGADLVHLNLPTQAVDFPPDMPVVVASHSCLATWWEAVRGDTLPDEWRWQQRRTREGFDRADVVMAPSHSHADALLRVYGPIDGLQVVPNAIALPRHPIEPKEAMVVSAGRWWDDGKNGQLLDQAAAQSPWPVVMVGPLVGPAGQRVEFGHAQGRGELPADVLQALMERAAIFMSPSRYEPFGLAVGEAAARRTALILADIPTFRELWDGVALFVAVDDSQACAKAIQTLVDDPVLRQDLANRAHRRAGEFTKQRQLDGVRSAYAQAMQRPDPARRPISAMAVY